MQRIMSSLYPLRFRPVLRHYLWGGSRLVDELGKQSSDPPPLAESWEIVDHDQDQSVVLYGELVGKSLRELMLDHGAELVGEEVWRRINRAEVPKHLQGRFPLLFKFLDAQRVLSVQVHPDNSQGAKLSPPDLGKTEAWYVMDAEPGSKIYAGLKQGVDRETLRQAVAEGRTESVLHQFEPRSGDTIFIPAGTVHALGAGLLIAEIQQASNTTYRIYDWNRLDKDGQPRPLHVEQAMGVIDFASGPVSPIREPSSANDQNPTVTSEAVATSRLVECEEFSLSREVVTGSYELDASNSFQILVGIRGEFRCGQDPSGEPVRRGETMLVPFGHQVTLQSEHDCVLLRIELIADIAS